jgi:hypothetical protein
VLEGGHTAALAETLENHLRLVKGNDTDTVTHIFTAASNALVFILASSTKRSHLALYTSTTSIGIATRATNLR